MRGHGLPQRDLSGGNAQKAPFAKSFLAAAPTGPIPPVGLVGGSSVVSPDRSIMLAAAKATEQHRKSGVFCLSKTLACEQSSEHGGFGQGQKRLTFI